MVGTRTLHVLTGLGAMSTLVMALACGGVGTGDEGGSTTLTETPSAEPAPDPEPAPEPEEDFPRFVSAEAGGEGVYAIQEDGTTYLLPLAERGRPLAGPDHQLDEPIEGSFQQISSEMGFNTLSCGITTEGGISCWGDDNEGQVGSAPAEGDFQRVEVGTTHACAMAADSTVTCWGSARRGAEGAPEGPVQDLSSWAGGTCALAANDEVTCWGRNVRVEPLAPGPWSDIAIGKNGICALDDEGHVHCAGARLCGSEEGRQVCTSGEAPDGYAAIPSGQVYQAIDVDDDLACGLRAETGAIDCWGVEQDGSTEPPDGRFTQVTVGPLYACAIREDGALLCWGAIDPSPSTGPDHGPVP